MASPFSSRDDMYMLSSKKDFFVVFILADISSKNLDSNERNQFFYAVTKISDMSKSLIHYLFVIVF